MTACGKCGTRYGGTRTEHCTAPGCHATFTGHTAGDMHRVGQHGVAEGEDRRRCLTVEEMTEAGMERNDRGIWTTGEHMPAERFSAWGRN